MITSQQTPAVLGVSVAIFIVGVFANVSQNSSFAQEIRYDDRIGSNKDFDMAYCIVRGALVTLRRHARAVLYVAHVVPEISYVAHGV